MKRYSLLTGYILILVLLIFGNLKAQEFMVVSIMDLEYKGKNPVIKNYTHQISISIKNSLRNLPNVDLVEKEDILELRKKYKASKQQFDNDLVLQRFGRRLAADLIFFGRVKYFKNSSIIRVKGRLLSIKTGMVIATVSISDFLAQKNIILTDFTSKVRNLFKTKYKFSVYAVKKRTIKNKAVKQRKKKKDKKLVIDRDSKLKYDARNKYKGDARSRSVTFNVLFRYDWALPKELFASQWGLLSTVPDTGITALGADFIFDVENTILSFGFLGKFYEKRNRMVEISAYFELHFLVNDYYNRNWQFYWRTGIGFESRMTIDSSANTKYSTSLGMRYSILFLLTDISIGLDYTSGFRTLFTSIGSGLRF